MTGISTNARPSRQVLNTALYHLARGIMRFVEMDGAVVSFPSGNGGPPHHTEHIRDADGNESFTCTCIAGEKTPPQHCWAVTVRQILTGAAADWAEEQHVHYTLPSEYQAPETTSEKAEADPQPVADAAPVATPPPAKLPRTKAARALLAEIETAEATNVPKTNGEPSKMFSLGDLGFGYLEGSRAAADRKLLAVLLATTHLSPLGTCSGCGRDLVDFGNRSSSCWDCRIIVPRKTKEVAPAA